MTKRILTLFAVALTLSLITACSNDDDNVVDPVVGEINVLLIQSDNGKTSTGTMYKSGETYNPPHCYIGKGIVYNDNTPTYSLSYELWSQHQRFRCLRHA